MKILITNTVALNVGDAAILLAEIQLLKSVFGENDIEILVYDSQPQASTQYYPGINFGLSPSSYISKALTIKYIGAFIAALNGYRLLISSWLIRYGLTFISRFLIPKDVWQSLVDYSSADLIISTGGTVLVENYSLRARIIDYQVCLMLQRPLVFYTQSLGPFSIPYNCASFKDIFDKALLILLRDQRSAIHLSDIKVKNSNIHVFADAAFALADTSAIQYADNEHQCVEAHHQKGLKTPLKVAISVREWRFFEGRDIKTGMTEYIKALQVASKHLIEQYSAKITYVSTCQGIPEYWTDDSKLASMIVQELSAEVKEQIIVDQTFHSPEQLALFLKQQDLVISTRLHMAILALGVGVPVLPIAYEFKTKELFEHLNLGNWVVDIDSIDSESFIHLIDMYLTSLPQIKKLLLKGVMLEYQSAINSASVLRDTYEKFKAMI
jgi:colanic acid/amylovoran biosynthesis protein